MTLEQAKNSIGKPVRFTGTKGKHPLVIKEITTKDGVNCAILEDQNPTTGWKTRLVLLSDIVLKK